MMAQELPPSLFGGEGGVCIVLFHTFPVHPLLHLGSIITYLASDSTFHINYSVLNEKKDPIKARKQIHHFLNWKSKHRQELIQQLNHYHQGPDLSLSLWLLFHAMVLPQSTLLLLNTSWLPCCGSKMTVTVSPSTIKGKKSGLSTPPTPPATYKGKRKSFPQIQLMCLCLIGPVCAMCPPIHL